MDRLTNELQIGPFASLRDKAEAKPGAFADYDCMYAHMVAVTRLKQYEDTGLMPNEVAALRARQEEDGWISTKDRLPPADVQVVAVVSGSPLGDIRLADGQYGGLRLKNAYMFASYYPEAGWAIYEYPEWEYPQVSYWMPLPKLPGGKT